MKLLPSGGTPPWKSTFYLSGEKSNFSGGGTEGAVNQPNWPAL